MARTQNEILIQTTNKYIAQLDRNNLPSTSRIEQELLDHTNLWVYVDKPEKFG